MPKIALQSLFVLSALVLSACTGSGSDLQGQLRRSTAPQVVVAPLNVDDETDPIETMASDSDVILTSNADEVKDGTYGIEAIFDETIGGGGASRLGDAGDCFLLDDQYVPGKMDDFQYLSFWMQSSENDVTYNSLAVAFDDDARCENGGDDSVVLGDGANTYVNGVLIPDGRVTIADGVRDQWVLVTVKIDGTVTADNTYVGFSVADGTVDWAATDELVIDKVYFHSEL